MSLEVNFITVQFHTTTDDKDDDTVVACTINRVTNGIKGPNLAAAENNWGGHLNDESWSPAMNLGYNPPGPWISGQEYALTVSIDPNGHDTCDSTVSWVISSRERRAGSTTFQTMRSARTFDRTPTFSSSDLFTRAEPHRQSHSRTRGECMSRTPAGIAIYP